jgi:hypothetical protein
VLAVPNKRARERERERERERRLNWTFFMSKSGN